MASDSTAPAPEQVHVTFGADAAREAVVSWAVPEPVGRPRLRLGVPGNGFGREVDAELKTYTDALTGQTVYTYHARLAPLLPDTEYLYQVVHTGADPVRGRFRTGPLGRTKAFRFTSFGDQSIPAPVGRGFGPWSPNAGYVVEAIEAADPLFHLVNGDLSYANISDDPVAQWAAFFNNNQRSAANRPWMPACGNHENEVGNGPYGYRSYQTRFTLPDNGQPEDFQGSWYAFTVGNLRIISLNNDDVCLQDGGFSTYRRDHMDHYVGGCNPYVRGYSGGAQKVWLERTLADAARLRDIDWIVVVMHQTAMSSAHFNGADLGIRQEWLPLFDRYGVDLVLSGHEHHFEQTFAVRGTVPGSALLTPASQGDDPNVVDTSRGTVHLVIGGGGHPSFTPPTSFDCPHDGVVIAGVRPGSPQVVRESIVATEPAAWSAYRDVTTPYGFATFDVDPAAAGGRSTITVTQYGAAEGSPYYAPVRSFTLTRPNRHGHRPLAGKRVPQPAGV